MIAKEQALKKDYDDHTKGILLVDPKSMPL